MDTPRERLNVIFFDEIWALEAVKAIEKNTRGECPDIAVQIQIYYMATKGLRIAKAQ